MTIKTNDKYWDCECKAEYIHKKENGNYCKECRAFEEDCPDSRVNELKNYRLINDLKILFRTQG